jgi:hypothetical protein
MWGLRAGLGYQKSFYSELGVSYHKIGGDVTIPQSRCLYSSIEWIPKILPEKENNILGFKIGGVYSASMGVFALEAKYQTDFKNRDDFVFTPKIGFGPWDVISILYGYNISMVIIFQQNIIPLVKWGNINFQLSVISISFFSGSFENFLFPIRFMVSMNDIFYYPVAHHIACIEENKINAFNLF